jgi:hypothetical protein
MSEDWSVINVDGLGLCIVEDTWPGPPKYIAKGIEDAAIAQQIVDDHNRIRVAARTPAGDDRRFLAAKDMLAAIVGQSFDRDGTYRHEQARLAVLHADALLTALDKPKGCA